MLVPEVYRPVLGRVVPREPVMGLCHVLEHVSENLASLRRRVVPEPAHVVRALEEHRVHAVREHLAQCDEARGAAPDDCDRAHGGGDITDVVPFLLLLLLLLVLLLLGAGS